MKSRALIIFTILSLVIAIMIPEVAAAKGGKPPQDEDPSAARLLYGDLVVLERDGAGVPLTRDIIYVDPHTDESVTVACLQPLKYDCSLLFLWGECGESEDCEFDPEAHDACEVWEGDAEYIQEVSFGRGSVTRSKAFVIDSAYGEFLKVINDATDLHLDPAGRFVMYIPSETDPVFWFDKTVDAPLENLGMYKAAMSYGCFNTVTEETTGEEGATVIHTSALDPSAIQLLRLTGLSHLVCDYGENEPPVWSADDQEKECQVTDDPVDGTADEPCWWESPVVSDRTLSTYEPGEGVDQLDMNSATAFLAGATDKGDPMSLDEAITINTYMGINPWILEGSKKDQTLTIKYFPFATEPEDPAASWFAYRRDISFPTSTTAELMTYDSLTNFRAFWDPTPLALFNEAAHPAYPLAHVDLVEVNLQVCRGGSNVAEFCDDSSADVVYDPDENTFGCGGANWFAQATEHARKTVWYLHNWSVPELDN